MPGLQLSLDWYSIENKDAIDQLGSQAIVDNCYAGSTSFCSLITRNATTNELVFVQNKYLNVSKEKVEGLDAEADYERDVTWIGGAPEQISLRLIGSYLAKPIPSAQDTGTLRGRRPGRAGCHQLRRPGRQRVSLPRFQGIGHLAYTRGPLRALIEERFIAKGKVDHAYRSGVDIDDNIGGSVAYTDLDVSYAYEDTGSGTLTLYGHITNAFDGRLPSFRGSRISTAPRSTTRRCMTCWAGGSRWESA
ncbi:MAG: TonB-dependent receptor [Gammaproteobacteria bacterium]